MEKNFREFSLLDSSLNIYADKMTSTSGQLGKNFMLNNAKYLLQKSGTEMSTLERCGWLKMQYMFHFLKQEVGVIRFL